MKKKLLSIVLLIVIALGTFGLIACAEHQHTYSDEWGYNQYNHFHRATCEHGESLNLVTDKYRHSLDANEICTVCGYDKQNYQEDDNAGNENGGNTDNGDNQGGGNSGGETGGNQGNDQTGNGDKVEDPEELEVIGEVTDEHWQRVLGLGVDSTKNITVFNTVLSYDDPSRVQETTSVMLIDFENQISKQISTLDYINLLQNLEQWVFFYDNKTYLYEKIVNNGIDEKTSLSNTVPNFSVLSNLDNVSAIKYASIDYKKLFSYDNGKKAYVYTDYSHEEWYIDPNGSMLIEIQFLEYDNYKITKKYLDSQGNIEGLYSYTFTNINTTGSLTIPQYVLDLVQK